MTFLRNLVIFPRKFKDSKDFSRTPKESLFLKKVIEFLVINFHKKIIRFNKKGTRFLKYTCVQKELPFSSYGLLRSF